jgi:DNA repair exonuclease SbcCD nuclease subunit
MSYKIAHLADVHWRGLTRHAEYKRSFTDAFKKMREAEVDAIFVVGDIVHSKTQGISPELIDSLAWWFKELDSVATTFITLGNHDGLILNKDRQDAISPIIHALNLPNLHLIKDSVVVEGALKKPGLPQINLANFSCFDEKGWNDLKLPSSGINVALYHGAVFGSMTDSSWELDGEIEHTFFKGFDFTFLGDIHKHQYLDDDKRIAYPGSTIQQNFGETPDKGFLLWDIESKDEYASRHVPVMHDRPYVTVDWQGNVPNTIDAAEEYPDFSRFRIRTPVPINQGEIKQLYASLKEFKRASEIVMKHEASKAGLFVEALEKNPRQDFRDPSVVAKTITEYYDKAGISEKTKERLVELVHSLWKNAVKLEKRNAQKWSLHSMEFDNVFGYGKDNTINFDNLEGIVGCFGRNRVGKSSIPGTMMYTLFNTTDRGSLSNLHVVNTRKGHCKSSAIVSSLGNFYKIERQTVKRQNRKGDLSASTQLNLTEVDSSGAILRDLCGEQRRDTEKTLRSIVGDPDDFLLTSMASQGEMNSFIKQKASARKSILSRFLELGVFDMLHAAARDESAGLKQIMKSVPDREYDVAIVDARNKLKSKEKQRDQTHELLSTLRQGASSIELALATRGDSNLVTSSDAESQKILVSTLRSDIVNEKNNTKLLDEKVLDLQSKIEKISDFKLNFPLEDIKSSIEEKRSLEITINEKKHDIDKNKQNIKVLKKETEKLEDVPCSKTCPVNGYIVGATKALKKLKKQEGLLEDLREDLSQIRKVHYKISKRDLEGDLEKYEDLLSKLNLYERDQNNLRLEYVKSSARLEKLKRDLKSQDTKLSEMMANVVEDDSAKELNELRTRLRKTKSEVSLTEIKYSQVSESIGLLQSDINKLVKDKEQFDELNQQWRVFELFMHATSKNGVPLQVIRSRLPEINAEIASILQGVTGFTVELESLESSADMQIYINYGDSKRMIECCSGMEKMMSALAIRVALINVSNLPKPDMLIIDEGFGSLDSGNVEACNRFLESLKRWFRIILVISHIDAVKDGVDNILEISRKGADAKISHE